MYNYSSILIASVIFVLLLVAIEVGYRMGINTQSKLAESSKSQVNTLQASLLGILALLIGFTFSLALQHYDSRSEAVVDSANAIGTAHLRAKLLPSSIRDDSQNLVQEYLDLRVQAGRVSLNREDEREPLLVKAGQTLDELWRYARRSAEEDGGPVTSGLFVQALNEVIDSYGSRDAALKRHVPEVVLFLLFGTFVMTGALVGYASGLSGNRVSFATYILVLLIVLLVFIIIDLDRPRRGLITVSQDSFIDLQASIEASKD